MAKLGSVETMTSAVEDYAKAIYALETRCDGAVSTNAIAERLSVSAASASAMVKKLDGLGLVSHTPYHGVQLTPAGLKVALRSEEHTSELQSHDNLVCRLLLDRKYGTRSGTRQGGNGRAATAR